MSSNISKLDANQVLRQSYDDEQNRLRVDAEVTAVIGDLDISIDAAQGDNIAIADQTGTNYLDINPDGSLNVNVITSLLTTKNIFNEITSVPSGVTSTVASYTALANTKLLSVDVGGTNVATFSIFIGSDLSAKKYTYYQNLNERFDFKDGLPVITGNIILVQVIHNRPTVGSFSANVLVEN